MSVLKYFKNIPRSPPIGRQALSVIFFLQIRNEIPGKKKGACRPLGGDRVPSPYISPGRHMPPSPLSFEPKNSGKKRGWGEEKRRNSAELRTCDLPVTSV